MPDLFKRRFGKDVNHAAVGVQIGDGVLPIQAYSPFCRYWGWFSYRAEQAIKHSSRSTDWLPYELKYHYPSIDSELLAEIKEQELATLQLSEVIACPSRVTRDYLASLGLKGQRIAVIPNRVSPSDFSASSLPSCDGRKPLLLYIGTLANWQGLEALIKVLLKILEQQAVRLQK